MVGPELGGGATGVDIARFPALGSSPADMRARSLHASSRASATVHVRAVRARRTGDTELHLPLLPVDPSARWRS